MAEDINQKAIARAKKRLQKQIEEQAKAERKGIEFSARQQNLFSVKCKECRGFGIVPWAVNVPGYGRRRGSIECQTCWSCFGSGVENVIGAKRSP